MTTASTTRSPAGQSGRRWALATAGLLMTLGVGSLPFPVWDHELSDVVHMVGNELIYWALTVATLCHVRFVEKRPLRSIGWRRMGWRDVVAAVGAALLMLAAFAVLYMVVFPALHVDEGAQVDRLLGAPAWWLFASAIRAGVSEEILFRGYPIERLEELTGRRALAWPVPLVVFSLAHAASWGWLHVAVAFVGGAMLTGLYIWRRNLGINILAHCLVDLVSTVA